VEILVILPSRDSTVQAGARIDIYSFKSKGEEERRGLYLAGGLVLLYIVVSFF
jgi:hypothetical protein